MMRLAIQLRIPSSYQKKCQIFCHVPFFVLEFIFVDYSLIVSFFKKLFIACLVLLLLFMSRVTGLSPKRTSQVLPEDIIFFIVRVIKKKQELRFLSDDFVRTQLFSFLERNPKLILEFTKGMNIRSKGYKIMIKEVRALLRRAYGLFRNDSQLVKSRLLVDSLENASSFKRKKLIEEILQLHSSTRERFSYYKRLYKDIFAITGKPQTILDLGCGLNPFSIDLMRLRRLHYYAYDLSEIEVSLLERFFFILYRLNSLFRGEAKIVDISTENFYSPSVDVCFLFKMTDVLDEGKGHKKTELLMQSLRAKHIVVSFATRTMSGKMMTAPRRRWMEWLCNRRGWSFQILTYPTEIFYVISKE